MLNNEVIDNVSKRVFENYPKYDDMYKLCMDLDRMYLYSMYTSNGLMELKRTIFRKQHQDFNLNFLKDVYDAFLFEGTTGEEMLQYCEDTYFLLKTDSQLKKVYGMLLPEVQTGIPREQEFLSIYDIIFVQIIMAKKIALNISKLCYARSATIKKEEEEKREKAMIDKQKEETLASLGIIREDKKEQHGK